MEFRIQPSSSDLDFDNVKPKKWNKHDRAGFRKSSQTETSNFRGSQQAPHSSGSKRLKTPSLRAKAFGWDEDIALAPRPRAVGGGHIDIDPDIDLSLVNQSGEGKDRRHKDGRHVDKWQEKLKEATSRGKSVREKRADWWKGYRENQGGFKKKEAISDHKKKVILMKYERIKKKNKGRAPIQWEDAAGSGSESDEGPVRERPKKKKKDKNIKLDGDAKPAGSKFEQAQRRYEEIQEERKKHREEVAAARQKHQESVKEYLQKRKERFRNFSRKTKKGQPLMKYRIEYLLGRVQDMMEKEKE